MKADVKIIIIRRRRRKRRIKNNRKSLILQIIDQKFSWKNF